MDVDDDLEALKAREAALRQATRDWSVASIRRQYPDDADEAAEDYEDDLLLLEEHGYRARLRTDDSSAVFDLARPTGSVSTPPGATRTVRYPGKYEDAFAAFQYDATRWAKGYWYPTAQTYVPGSWGCGAWVVAFLAMVILVGLIALAYMIAVRPAGELVVTYEYRPPARAAGTGRASVRPARRVGTRDAAPKDDVADQIRKLAALRDDGILTEEEFAAKKRQLLGL